MSHAKKNLSLTDAQLNDVINTLTPYRLGKYLQASSNDRRIALKLYSFNAHLSAAMFIDMHYLEVSLRNNLDEQLRIAYNTVDAITQQPIFWFDNQTFLDVVAPLNIHGHPPKGNHIRKIIEGAKNKATPPNPPGSPTGLIITPPPGKVIAELNFGFWHRLCGSGLEHSLWTPCLINAFAARAPSRSILSNRLDIIRTIRNRIAHHEPLNLNTIEAIYDAILEVQGYLCPATMQLLKENSVFLTKLKEIKTYRKRKRIA